MADLDETYLYVPESEYSHRVPTPPRINVPPPGLHATPPGRHGALRIKPSHGDPTLEALRFLDNCKYDIRDGLYATFTWSYEDRRQAQEILPFLYLGPMNAVGDRDFLRRQGVTMLLAVRPTSSKQSIVLNRALRVADELGLQKGALDVGTAPELIALLPTAVRMINEHLIQVQQRALRRNGQASPDQGIGKVLVFCETGNERSAAVVAAYMMQMFADVSLIQAVQYVQSRRFCVNLDDDMKSLLSNYLEILKARQDVAASAQQIRHYHQTVRTFSIGSSQRNGGAGTKRRYDESNDDEEDMDVDGYNTETSGRGVAPFRDTELGE